MKVLVVEGGNRQRTTASSLTSLVAACPSGCGLLRREHSSAGSASRACHKPLMAFKTVAAWCILLGTLEVQVYALEPQTMTASGRGLKEHINHRMTWKLRKLTTNLQLSSSFSRSFHMA